MDQDQNAASLGGNVAPSAHLGANQTGMRAHNERVVLSLVREHGSLSKTEIARLAQVSAQTASVIMRKLEDDGLLLRGKPVRGKIGQPSIPMNLNPNGAFFLGFKVGRRSADMVLIDFLGTVRRKLTQSYAYPTPDVAVAFAEKAVREVQKELRRDAVDRIRGMGIAMPFELWDWQEQSGAPEGCMDEWRIRDIGAELHQRLGLEIFVQNDATSACGAELVFGNHGHMRNFVYFYIGAFAGGGIVLDGRLHGGVTGNAGALGSMPVPGPGGRIVQLIDVASLAVFERELIAGGQDSSWLWSDPDAWAGLDPNRSDWLRAAGKALAHAIASATSVMDFEAAVIDGWMPASVRAELVQATRAGLNSIDMRGMRSPVIREGTVGAHARAIGAASLPLSASYLVGTRSALGV